MSGEMIPLFMLGLVIVTFWLSIYVFGLFCVGRWLAERYRLRVSRYAAVVILAVASAILALPALAVPLDPILKLTLVFGLWVIHGQPTSVGYWSTCERRRLEDEERWRLAASEWIEEFEEDAPIWMRDFDDES